MSTQCAPWEALIQKPDRIDRRGSAMVLVGEPSPGAMAIDCTNSGRTHSEDAEHAQRIVRCVNSHEALVQALLAALPILEREDKRLESFGKSVQREVKAVRAALTKAGAA